jgi:hypothetical protein
MMSEPDIDAQIGPVDRSFVEYVRQDKADRREQDPDRDRPCHQAQSDSQSLPSGGARRLFRRTLSRLSPELQ